MAQAVKGSGIGGQTLAEPALGWNRRTIRQAGLFHSVKDTHSQRLLTDKTQDFLPCTDEGERLFEKSVWQ